MCTPEDSDLRNHLCIENEIVRVKPGLGDRRNCKKVKEGLSCLG
jgi:hypothetical protein